MKNQVVIALALLIASGLTSADNVRTTLTFPGSFSPTDAAIYSQTIDSNLKADILKHIQTGEIKINYVISPADLKIILTTPAAYQIWLGASNKGDMSQTCACWDANAKGGRGDNVCHFNQGVACGDRKDLFKVGNPMVISCTTGDQRHCYTSYITVNPAQGTMTIQSEGGATTWR